MNAGVEEELDTSWLTTCAVGSAAVSQAIFLSIPTAVMAEF